MTYHKSLFFIIIAFFLYSCAEDEETIDFSIAIEEFDLEYGEDPLQTYDLYLPANRSTAETDVIILIHGGSWTGGDKDDVDGISDLLQETMPGYAIVNMNYRLDIDADDLFGGHLDDVESVVKTIAEENEDWGVSERMVMAGVSAGGHMTLLYSYTNNLNDYVKVACNIVGPTYFLDDSYTMATNPTYLATVAAIVAFTQTPLSSAAYYEAVSPLSNVIATVPPTIQFHGDMDPLIPITQGQLLADELDDKGVPNELIIYEGEGHGWVNPDNWTDTALRFKAFVEAHL